MKMFLIKINELIRQLEKEGRFQKKILIEVNEVYQSLTDIEKNKSIEMLAEVMQEDYKSFFLIMSALLVETKSAFALSAVDITVDAIICTL